LSKPTLSMRPAPAATKLSDLDYSVLQQCMHCGMCLPTCPTYDATKLERHSPRGRISLMRAIADGDLGATAEFGKEMYFCLGCLACETACPAGVDYANLFEVARSEVERAGVMKHPKRNAIRAFTLRGLFMHPRALRIVGRLLWIYQVSGLQWAFRALRLTALLPRDFRELEPITPAVRAKFSDALIARTESPPKEKKYRVALLTGCVQDLVLSEINRDTADVLLANGCEVFTPREQPCCGSLHGHNGEVGMAKDLARRLIDLVEPATCDAIISNAGGCGSHLRHYDRLLADDPTYRNAAAEWSRKLKDVHEFLVEIGFRAPAAGAGVAKVTYHESCHLSHGQGIVRQPRQILRSIPGLELVELPESQWCCGSAGIYNITQPEMAAKLQDRKMGHIAGTGAPVVATANPGCHLQIENGAKDRGLSVRVLHPVSLLAAAYRAERAAH